MMETIKKIDKLTEEEAKALLINLIIFEDINHIKRQINKKEC